MPMHQKMNVMAEVPCGVAPFLEEPGKDCSPRQLHRGLQLTPRIAVATMALVTVALLGPAAAEVIKDVNCRFELMVDDNDAGKLKQTEDGLKYALCVTEEIKVYYLLADSTTDKLPPGDSVSLTIVEVTHSSPTIGPKPPWEMQGTPLYKVLSAQTRAGRTRAGGRKQEMHILTILCSYNDHSPDYITEHQAELDLFATPSDLAAGDFHGSTADMIKKATYGKVTMPRSKAKTVTVRMGSNWASVSGCPYYAIAAQALQKLKEQHPSINPEMFHSRELFIPRSPNGGCTWGGLGNLGCAHPSILPGLGGCLAWYRFGGPFIRAHELGHNLGLMHAGGDKAGRLSNFVEYGDPQAAMGASYRFSSFIASSRFFLGALRTAKGEVVDWSNGASTSLNLGSKSLPLGQAGEDAVAIKMWCPRCVPKVSKHVHNVGGYIWVSFRGNEGYSAVQNKGLQARFQNKVYVHLARKVNNLRYNAGSELWKVLETGDSYQPEGLQHTIHVCYIMYDLAQVSVGRSAADASSKCSPLRPLAIRWATHPDKCLDVSGGVNRDGTNIQLWDCVDNGEHENMKFLMPLSGRMTGRIHWAKHPDKCLDVSAGNTGNGANLQIWTCTSIHEHPNMRFTLPQTQGPIKWSTHPNKCIDVSRGRTVTGTNIQMWDCANGGQHPNMMFTIRTP